MGKKMMRLACRDCKKCTNSEIANLGRNSGRILAGLMTAGTSEAGFLATKTCRQCGHALSLHGGDTVLNNADAVSTMVGLTTATGGSSVPAANGLQTATRELTSTELTSVRKILQSLPPHLDDDETAIVVSTCQVTIDNSVWPRTAVLVLTDRYLRLMQKDDTTATSIKLDYRTDSSVRVKRRGEWLSDVIEVNGLPNNVKIVGGASRNTQTFENELSKLRTTAKTKPPGHVDPPIIRSADDQGAPRHGSPVEALTQIQRLAEMHQSGVLSNDEFQAAKARLLDRL